MLDFFIFFLQSQLSNFGVAVGSGNKFVTSCACLVPTETTLEYMEVTGHCT